MWRVFRYRAQSMGIGGMNVFTSNDSDMGRAVAVRARLGLALELIDQYAPRVGARLRRDVVAIFLWRVGGTSYNPYTRVISVDVRWGMAWELEDLALALVHEATHARQMAMGLRKLPRGKDRERRMEARAVSASMAFADRLPPGTWRKPTLADLDKEWWTIEHREARLAKDAKEIGLTTRPIRMVAAATRLLGLRR
ncbi:MAG TPA: hypothetical protein VNV25_19270 [Gemmatimonadaceae bacterium]|nr:hypothetical protein [Gemmatimonadaceae bacterium]